MGFLNPKTPSPIKLSTQCPKLPPLSNYLPSAQNSLPYQIIYPVPKTPSPIKLSTQYPKLPPLSNYLPSTQNSLPYQIIYPLPKTQRQGFLFPGGEEYSMRSLFFTWTFIIVVIGGLCLALVCIGHRYALFRRKQNVTITNTRASRPAELSRRSDNKEEMRELTSHDTDIS